MVILLTSFEATTTYTLWRNSAVFQSLDTTSYPPPILSIFQVAQCPHGVVAIWIV